MLSEGELLFDNYELQEASDEGLDALRLDSYIDLYRGFQVTTLASERGVFGFATRNTMSESVRTDVLKTRLDRARVVRTAGVLQSVIGTVTSLTNYAHVMNGFWTPDMHDLLLKTYIGFASDFDARVENIVSGGLVEVFEGDPDQVRNVAAISLGASAELSPEGLAELSDVPLDPSAAIRRLRASWPVDGCPLASTGPDGFLATLRSDAPFSERCRFVGLRPDFRQGCRPDAAAMVRRFIAVSRFHGVTCWRQTASRPRGVPIAP